MRKVKYGGLLGALVVLVALTTGCTRIQPGHVGIKINLSGSYRGVEDVPVSVGWVFYNPMTQVVFEYPVYVQTAKWEAAASYESPGNEEISFTTKEGMLVTGDISLSYQLEEKLVPRFWIEFRNDNLRVFTHGYLRNVARDILNETAGHFGIEEIYGEKKDVFIQQIRAELARQVNPLGVKIKQMGFIGAMRIPPAVLTQLNEKVSVTQQALTAENNVRKTKADADSAAAFADGKRRAAVANAEGQARANDLLGRSITPTLLEWRRLELQGAWIEKWKGDVASVQTGSGGGMILQMPAPTNGR